MAGTKQTPEDVKAAFVDLAFDEAYRIREELYGSEDEPDKPGIFARRSANREQLRSLAKQGFLSREQAEELSELYPARQRKAEEEEEQAASEPTETANA